LKLLFLIRHAKSSWDYPELADVDRPLNERGKRNAAKMGKRLAQRKVKPDLILSSSARRAFATAKIIAKELAYPKSQIAVQDRLYAVNADELTGVIRKLNDEVDCVLLIGHNPELTELAHRLSSKITDMPTCAVAEFAFSVTSWSDFGKARPDVVEFDYPKKS
jgi:phosphohistidine phosphatase